MKLTCFIIDDEPLAIEVLESHIAKMDSIEIAGTFGNALKAVEALQETRVDLIFLDIQMPKLTGVEFLKTIRHPPKVIFTTAYREYALEGFELNVVDYLLKPISFERFLKAVNKVYELHANHISTENSKPKADEFIFVSSGKEQVKIRLAEILFLESKGDYVFIKTTNKEVTTHSTLTAMETQLPDELFIRVHRSYIVNLNQVESWSNTEIKTKEQKIPIGRSFKRQAIKALKQHAGSL